MRKIVVPQLYSYKKLHSYRKLKLLRISKNLDKKKWLWDWEYSFLFFILSEVEVIYLAAESIQKTDPYIRNILDTTNQTVDQTGKNKIHWGYVKFRVKSSMECYSIILKSLSICITFSTWSDAIGQCISPIKWESDNWSHKVSLQSVAWGFWKKISKSIKNWGGLV